MRPFEAESSIRVHDKKTKFSSGFWEKQTSVRKWFEWRYESSCHASNNKRQREKLHSFWKSFNRQTVLEKKFSSFIWKKIYYVAFWGVERNHRLVEMGTLLILAAQNRKEEGFEFLFVQSPRKNEILYGNSQVVSV